VGARVGSRVGGAVGTGVAGSGVGAGGSDGIAVAIGLGSSVGGTVTIGATSDIRSGTGVPCGVIRASSGRRSELRATWGRLGRGRRSSRTTGGAIVGTGWGVGGSVGAGRCGRADGTSVGTPFGTICARSATTGSSRLSVNVSSPGGPCDPIAGVNERTMKKKPTTMWMMIETV
jgi:hypothetical protein